MDDNKTPQQNLIPYPRYDIITNAPSRSILDFGILVSLGLMRNTIKITIIAVIVLPIMFMWNTWNAQIATAPIQAIAQTEQTETIPTNTLPWILRDGSKENPTIPWCESRNQQFNADGMVLLGRINRSDIGKYQINLTHHGTRAIELGIDLYTEEGNTKFALLLFYESGTTPWNWSKSCWS